MSMQHSSRARSARSLSRLMVGTDELKETSSSHGRTQPTSTPVPANPSSSASDRVGLLLMHLSYQLRCSVLSSRPHTRPSRDGLNGWRQFDPRSVGSVLLGEPSPLGSTRTHAGRSARSRSFSSVQMVCPFG